MQPQAPGQKPVSYSSQQLFAGQQVISITHNGQIYQLRITSNGKLLLVK